MVELPFLDFTKADFSTRSQEVINARAESWVAKTPYGLAVLCHREAGLLLRDRRLRQGSYAWPNRQHLSGSFAEFWQRAVISQEGEPHKAMRRVMMAALSDQFVHSLRPSFQDAADQLLEPLSQKTNCEFMSEFSVPFAGMVNCALLGLPFEDWPEVSLHASNLGLAMGLDCQAHQTTFNASCDWLNNLADTLINKAKKGSDTESYVARLMFEFDQFGDHNPQTLRDLIVISIFGGVDTTKAQLGFLMCLIGDHADQWQELRNNSEMAANAIQEAVRNRPTTTWATREAVEDFTFQDVAIRKGTTVHILTHASGTDPKVHFGKPFNILAKRKAHFGFGGGAHHCIGHMLAKTDMEVAVQALAKRIKEFEITSSEFLPDSGNTSPTAIYMHYSCA